MINARTLLALGTAATLAAASIVGACSGFSSEEAPPTSDAGDATTVDSGGTLAADAAPLCGETALCLNFDDEAIPLSYGGLEKNTEATLDSGVAIVERTEAGAVSKPFAAGFSISGTSFVAASLRARWPQHPGQIRIRGALTVEHGSSDTAALAIILQGTGDDGGLRFVSLMLLPKASEPTLVACRLAMSVGGGAPLGALNECGGGEIIRGTPQAFSLTVELTPSGGGRATFALNSAGGTLLTASADLAAAELSSLDAIDFGIQSGFYGPGGGTHDAGEWLVQFDDVSIEPKPATPTPTP